MRSHREDVAGSGRLPRERRVLFLGNLSGNAGTSADRRTTGSSLASDADDENQYQSYLRSQVFQDEFIPLSHTPRPVSPEVFPNHKVIRMYRLNPDGSFIYSSSSEEEDEGDRPKKSQEVKKGEKKSDSDAKTERQRLLKLGLPVRPLRLPDVAPPK